MSNKALILCVDDEPVNLVIMEELLRGSYELTTADSGRECLHQVELRKPDLILLDVNMPDLDGLGTCEQLKSDPATSDIPVVFVSALASQAELMAGYEAGGDDYITKPFSEEILRKKIEIVLASQHRKQELKQISDQAVEALMDNLSTTDELGMVVEFLHQCQTTDTLDELASKVFDCLREFDLDGSLLILDEPENRIWFSDDIDRPMESQILESLRGQDRVVNFGTRLAMNSDHVTVLVRNLPSAPDKVDSVRKHLAILIEGLDTRIQSMQTRTLLDRRREVLARVLDSTRESLANLDRTHKQQKARSAKILSTMGKDLEKSLVRLKLSVRQEAVLKKLIESTAEQTNAVYDECLTIGQQFQEVIDELSGVLDE